MYRSVVCLLFTALLSQPAAAQTVTTLLTGIHASGGLSIGSDGRMYVADFGSRMGQADPGSVNVYQVSKDGRISVFSKGFGGASGNHFGSDGFLYQSDIRRGEAYRIASDGTRTRIAAGLKSPVGIVPGRGGVVYVTQCGDNTVSRIGPNGRVQTVAHGQPLNCPNGLTIGPDGDLYTSNFYDGAMVRINIPTRRMTVQAQIPGGGNGHLTIANGRFYVASFAGNRIFEVALDGTVCAIAGSGAPGNADGESRKATLFRPNGVAVSANGDTLYTNTTTRIVDANDTSLHPNAIRKVSGLRNAPPCGKNANSHREAHRDH